MQYPSCVDLEQVVPVEESKFLFHYTKYSSALGILRSQKLRLSSLATMNDPLEFQDHHGDGVMLEGMPTNEECASQVFMFENAVTEKEKSVRLACFSMDIPFANKTEGSQKNYYNNLSKGWARSRMWAQYAENHKGICLIFDKACLLETFSNTFVEKTCKTFCKAVNYTNNLAHLKDVLSQPCESYLTSDKIDFLFQKCEDFRDEQEFRLLLINKKLKDAKKLVSFSIADSLCGVIRGARFPDENKASLDKAIEACNPQIRHFSIWWDYGTPNLNDPAYWESLMPKDLLDGDESQR
jgi:hypothetical protein